jgi:hypothetical protein
MGFEAGPAATIPARERFYADTRASATRQRTLEANGIDCGAGPVSERSGLRRERNGSRSAERASELGEDRQVAAHADPRRGNRISHPRQRFSFGVPGVNEPSPPRF